MADTLAVHLNGEGSQSVAVPERFETTGSFELAIHNRGTPAHVHLHLDDDLGAVASVAANNHYVEADATRTVRIEVAESFGTVTGTLEVVTGYGAESDGVEVTVTEPTSVTVDESLAEPRTDNESRSLPTETVPAVLLAALVVTALVVAFGLLEESLVLPIGLLALAAGVGAAAYLLWSS